MTDATRSAGSTRVVAESALVAVVVLGYLWLFRAYGFDIVDEGTQLAQIDRVARGARPYIDFETGYTPWYYLLEVGLWRFSGAGLLATRTFGVLLHTMTITLVFAFARLWFGPLLALCLAAFDLAFLLPVSPRAGAPFNTPYPGWLTAPLALAAQLAIAVVVVRRRRDTSSREPGRAAGALLGAGFAAGLACSIKPNAGVLALSGAMLALLPSWSHADRSARVVAWLVRGAAIAASILLLGGAALEPAYAAALLLPVFVAALAAAPVAARSAARPLADAALLGAGFLAPVVLWAVPLLRELGAARFAREVLLLDGGGVVGAYLLPLSLPDASVLVLCAGVVVAAALARRAAADARVSGAARWPALVALGSGVALAAIVAGSTTLLQTAEAACLWLGPTVLVAGLVLVPRTAETARVHALLAFAAVYSLQLFPRPDLIHVAMGAPPLLLAAGATWWWFAQPFARSRTAQRGLSPGWIAAGFVLILCAGRIYPALRVRLAEPVVALDAGPRAPLLIGERYAEEQSWIGAAVRAISARTAPGDAVFYFPDLAGLGFLAARPSPTFYLYFVPGRPDRRGEERTVAELERTMPRLAVTGSPRVPAFAAAGTYFTQLEAYLGETYRPVEPLRECTVRERTEGR